MERHEYQQLGIRRGVTAILDAIYDTNSHDIENDVLDACVADPQIAVELIRSLIYYTPGAFLNNWTSAAAGTPINKW